MLRGLAFWLAETKAHNPFPVGNFSSKQRSRGVGPRRHRA
jgi:hypothetical protein